MAKSNPPPLDINCIHTNSPQLCCRACAYDAATRMRQENDRQAAEILAWTEKWIKAEKAKLKPRRRK